MCGEASLSSLHCATFIPQLSAEWSGLCEESPDRRIHHCHNLFLSSPCSLIKTLFEVITFLLGLITPPSRVSWHAPSLLSVGSSALYVTLSILAPPPPAHPFCFHRFLLISIFEMNLSWSPSQQEGSPHPQVSVCHLWFLKSVISNTIGCAIIDLFCVFLVKQTLSWGERWRKSQSQTLLISSKFLSHSQTAGIMASKQPHKARCNRGASSSLTLIGWCVPWISPVCRAWKRNDHKSQLRY